MREKVLSDLRELERSSGNMRVHNVDVVRAAIFKIQASDNRIAEAVEVAENFAYTDEAHHKNWEINKMRSALLTDKESDNPGCNAPNWLEECSAP